MKLFPSSQDMNQVLKKYFPKLIIPKDSILFYSTTQTQIYYQKKIISSIQNYGPIENAVSWIHSHAENAHEVIGKILNSQNIKSDYFHILGSSYYNPDRLSSETEEFFSAYGNISYKKIILGFKIENGISRWLTDEEISKGVYQAVISGENEFKIGVTEPWDKRP